MVTELVENSNSFILIVLDLDSGLLCCVEDKSFDCKHCFSCQMAGQGLHILVQRMSLVCGSLHYHIRRMAHLQSPMALK